MEHLDEGGIHDAFEQNDNGMGEAGMAELDDEGRNEPRREYHEGLTGALSNSSKE